MFRDDESIPVIDESTEDSKFTPLGLRHLAYPFMLILFGYVIGSISFICELLIFHKMFK